MKTIIIGASNNPDRYSYKATTLLKHYGHEILPLGVKNGEIEGIPIIKDKPEVKDVDTITMYVNSEIQKDWYFYILATHPRRIIFNPGTENEELVKLASAHGIECLEACTLVMLNTNQY